MRPFYVSQVPAGMGFGGVACVVEVSVDLAGEVALGAASDLPVRPAFGSSLVNVGAGVRLVDHAGDHRHVQGSIQAPVTTATEPVFDRQQICWISSYVPDLRLWRLVSASSR